MFRLGSVCFVLVSFGLFHLLVCVVSFPSVSFCYVSVVVSVPFTFSFRLVVVLFAVCCVFVVLFCLVCLCVVLLCFGFMVRFVIFILSFCFCCCFCFV